MKTLNEIPIGKTVRVKRLLGEGPLKRRIMDMGILKGVDVTVLKVAPAGDPIEISLRGYDLSIRKSEAATIEIEEE
ncbi:ferrous iron transport protein A [bacterium]|nr:ferrous iron transport protein A [bacterium]